MKNIKDITISIFAIIGFISVLSSFNSNPPQSQIGKYQISSNMEQRGGQEFVLSTIMDTETGQIVRRNIEYSREYSFFN